jgi:hypothetical protein
MQEQEVKTMKELIPKIHQIPVANSYPCTEIRDGVRFFYCDWNFY